MEIQGRKNNGNGQEDRRRNEQKEDERRGERRKESVLVRFLRMPLFFSQGKDWERCGGISW